jgi:hypothetical protein
VQVLDPHLGTLIALPAPTILKQGMMQEPLTDRIHLA